MAQIHYRKIRSCFFVDVKENRKLFEIRKEDREPPFEVGDILILIEIDDDGDTTGRILKTVIEYIYRGEFCLPEYCVMSIRQLGYWKTSRLARNSVQCSLCGFLSYNASPNYLNFCPNCGTKMTGVIDNEKLF